MDAMNEWQPIGELTAARRARLGELQLPQPRLLGHLQQPVAGDLPGDGTAHRPYAGHFAVDQDRIRVRDRTADTSG